MRPLLTFILSILFICNSFAQVSNITITGKANTHIDYDMIVITFNVTEESVEYSQAVKGIKEKTEKLYSALSKVIPSDQIRTSSFNVNERRDYVNHRSVLAGYIASQTIIVKRIYESAEIDKILSTINKSEIDVKYNLSFTLSEGKRKKLKEELISKAVIDAKEKAEIITTAANVQLNKIEKIEYTDNLGSVGVPFELKSSSRVSSDSYNIQPNQTRLEESVTISWSIK